MLKKGDKVLIITGDDKGKIGIIIAKEKNYIRLEDQDGNFIKTIKKAVSKRTDKFGTGGYTKIPGKIHISNVKLLESFSYAENKEKRMADLNKKLQEKVEQLKNNIVDNNVVDNNILEGINEE